MTQTAIPYHFMRGGTSRGPYFLADDLPKDRETLAKVLISVIGAGHPLNIDGIGGGAAVTTKVAILSKSDDTWADVDYFFAQVSVEDQLVDFKPTCGNILVGVGPAAIEKGLIEAQDGVTEVKIRAVNTGAEAIARVETPGGLVRYSGERPLDGVPGTAAPIEMQFRKVTGSVTGAFLPTGNLRDVVGGVEVTCMDVAMPMVIARAETFGVTGDETREELDANADLFARIEAVRLEAGRLMGMGDVAQSVTPKFGLIAPARQDGSFMARYFMPWQTHPTMAVTGAQCLASSALTPGTVADDLWPRTNASPARVVIEHISGQIEVLVDFENGLEGFEVKSAGLVRTARLLARGEVFAPGAVWTR